MTGFFHRMSNENYSESELKPEPEPPVTTAHLIRLRKKEIEGHFISDPIIRSTSTTCIYFEMSFNRFLLMEGTSSRQQEKEKTLSFAIAPTHS